MKQTPLDSHIQMGEGESDDAEILAKGQVYGDERHSEIVDGEKIFSRQLEVVYQDEEMVLLRDVDDGRHRKEPVSQFREGVGNRWKLLESGDKDELLASLPDLAPILNALTHRREKYLNKSGQLAAHRAEALKEAIDIVSGYSPEPVEWDDISGVGDATAGNLRDAGIASEADVCTASDEELLAINGVGEQTVERIRDRFGDESKA